MIGPANLAIATTPSVTCVTLCTTSVTLNDTAVLSGGYSPTGTITFKLYDGSTLVDTEMATVNGNGSYTSRPGVAAVAVDRGHLRVHQGTAVVELESDRSGGRMAARKHGRVLQGDRGRAQRHAGCAGGRCDRQVGRADSVCSAAPP